MLRAFLNGLGVAQNCQQVGADGGLRIIALICHAIFSLGDVAALRLLPNDTSTGRGLSIGGRDRPQMTRIGTELRW